MLSHAVWCDVCTHCTVPPLSSSLKTDSPMLMVSRDGPSSLNTCLSDREGEGERVREREKEREVGRESERERKREIDRDRETERERDAG